MNWVREQESAKCYVERNGRIWEKSKCKKGKIGKSEISALGLWGIEGRQCGAFSNDGKLQMEGFNWNAMGRLNFSWWNDTQLEMTEVWSVERPGWLQTFTWKSLLEIEMETLRLAGFHRSVYEIGITVRSSWNHVFPFRTNRRNWCLPRSVLGTSEWWVCV